jgi:hypothetical protein
MKFSFNQAFRICELLQRHLQFHQRKTAETMRHGGGGGGVLIVLFGSK